MAPIIMWQIKKDEYPIIDVHGKNEVNRLISSAIYGLVGLLTLVFFVRFCILPAVIACGLVFPIIARIKAISGEMWKDPLTISF